MEGKIWDRLRKKEVALTPEEKVRQWFIGVLNERMGVPLHMMMSEVSMKLGGKPFRADILVYGRDTAPLMVVECKRQDADVDRAVLEQALKYNLVLDASYIVVTNGQKTFAFRRQGSGFKQLSSLPMWEEMTREETAHPAPTSKEPAGEEPSSDGTAKQME